MGLLPLFDNAPAAEFIPPADPLKERRKAMDAAFRYADERWRESYPTFILRWLERNGSGTAEDIRLAYDADTNNPPLSKSKRASGAIYTTLRRQGKIREIGKQRSKKYGNDLAVYGLVR